MNTMSNEESPAAAISFEQALAELDKIVGDLEEGQIPLAEGLARYEQGVKLLKQCYQLLEGAARRIELLSRVDSDGRPLCEPFDDEASFLEEKVQKRPRRGRTANSRDPEPGNPIDDSSRLF